MDENYEDVRVELQHISCNLTSVNTNPKESIFDELLEDFWEDVGMQASLAAHWLAPQRPRRMGALVIQL